MKFNHKKYMNKKYHPNLKASEIRDLDSEFMVLGSFGIASIIQLFMAIVFGAGAFIWSSKIMLFCSIMMVTAFIFTTIGATICEKRYKEKIEEIIERIEEESK